jgi:DNA-directed RNA polymerase subunit RPC12/RpoP
MPSYCFQCGKCKKEYSDLVSFDPSGKYKDTKCTSCGSKKKKMLPTAAKLKFSNPTDTSKFDNFSYRAGYNLEAAQDLRKSAEEVSHMGTDPYADRIDDINRGDLFGEVK